MNVPNDPTLAAQFEVISKTFPPTLDTLNRFLASQRNADFSNGQKRLLLRVLQYVRDELGYYLHYISPCDGKRKPCTVCLQESSKHNALLFRITEDVKENENKVLTTVHNFPQLILEEYQFIAVDKVVVW